MKIKYILPILFLATACTKQPKLEGLDLEKWKADKGGCSGERTKNIDKLKSLKEEIKGVKICKQANAKWEESFDERINPHGKKYYWLTGNFNNMDESEDADETALAKGYISIVPVKFDMTAYEYMNTLNSVMKFN